MKPRINVNVNGHIVRKGDSEKKEEKEAEKKDKAGE